MLVLSRKLGERVLIGDEICVQVLEVHGSRVRLGFTAPDGMPIRREELCFETPACSPPGAIRQIRQGFQKPVEIGV